jgi:hypothetical protein
MISNQERDFVASALEAFLEGSGGPWDFDDLIHDRYSDELVRASIQAVDHMPLNFPSSHPNQYCSDEGLIEIQRVIDILREKL